MDPSPRGVEGNEIAVSYAKRGAEGYADAVGPVYLQGTSPAQLSRNTTEAESQRTREWIRRHAKAGRRHNPQRLAEGGGGSD